LRRVFSRALGFSIKFEKLQKPYRDFIETFFLCDWGLTGYCSLRTKDGPAIHHPDARIPIRSRYSTFHQKIADGNEI
jgi:hypothetical protein